MFCDKAGMTKRQNLIEVELLESCVRDVLNKEATRVMVVQDPIKLTISNYEEGRTEMLLTDNNPEKPEEGTREIPFGRELYIEASDFMEDPPKKFFRLGPGRHVRLKSAYIIRCDDFVKNQETGKVEEIVCTYFPDSKSGEDTSGIKAKGTLHWVCQRHALDVEVREYDRLFSVESPTADEEKSFLDYFNADSLHIRNHVKAEPSLLDAKPLDHFQFMRIGYFSLDPDSRGEHLIFNRTVTLRDSWKKSQKK